MTDLLPAETWLDRPCPTCGAEAGSVCVTLHRHVPARVHLARRRVSP